MKAVLKHYDAMNQHAMSNIGYTINEALYLQRAAEQKEVVTVELTKDTGSHDSNLYTVTFDNAVGTVVENVLGYCIEIM